MPKSYAYFEGNYVPLEDAKISVMTHAFMYGTACFEGIRAYYSPEENQLFVFRMKEHFERLVNSCKILQIKPVLSVDGMCEVTLEALRRSEFREDVYIRPIAYKSSKAIGVKLVGLDDDFLVFGVPFGDYLDVNRGIRVQVSTWRHLEDNIIPPRAKVNGAYVNAALAKSEALQNGYDEAIFLSGDGHLSEGSAENLFLVKCGKLVTTPSTEDILEGITRNTIIELAKDELGIETVERRIDRTELYTTDECFLCGTGAQISPVIEVDHRPVGTGEVGPITRKLQELYNDVVHGRVARYRKWCAAVYND
ncbi:MAG TPA: branched-chain amino acid transaminase [Firmicutes bacterium]|nr:branched-chain amino acid transaminase [Bacillota bacterium]